MSKIIDTFSSNSLKVLDKNLEEFKNRYLYGLSFYKKDNRTILGEKFHSLICSYINNFDVSKLLFDLDNQNQKNWQKLKEYLEDYKNDFIKTEYSFLTKEKLNSSSYFLTGRFDAILKNKTGYMIFDWKTLNLPKNPENDLQTIVYLYCASIIFNCENIKMKYLSIEKLDFVEIKFEKFEDYKKRIDKIVLKYYSKAIS